MTLTEEQIAEIRARVASDDKIRVMDENSARRVNEIIFDRAALLSALEAANKRAAELEDCRNTLIDALADLRQWADSYPLNIFPEPDFARAAKALADAGMTIDAISASNMRHVLSRVKTIADAALIGVSHEQ